MNYAFRIMLNSIVHLETFFVLRVCYGTSCLVIKHCNLNEFISLNPAGLFSLFPREGNSRFHLLIMFATELHDASLFIHLISAHAC